MMELFLVQNFHDTKSCNELNKYNNNNNWAFYLNNNWAFYLKYLE